MTRQAISIDLRDRQVQQALGIQGGNAARKRRDVVHIAGDADVGLSAITNLSAGRQEVVVVYRDRFLTLDVYALPGTPMRAILICPRCCKPSTIQGDRKRIEFDAAAPNPMRTEIIATGEPSLIALADLGRISIEPFECAWEIGTDKHVAGGVHTGASLCRLRIGVTNNRALDA